MLKTFILSLILSIFFGYTASAQYSEKIGTARPGVSIGPGTVGKNILQFQQGLEYAFTDRKVPQLVEGLGEASMIRNNLNVINVTRFGLSRKFELSAVASYGSQQQYFVNKDGKLLEYLERQNSDLRLLDFGGRYNLRESKSGGPAIGVQARLGFQPLISRNEGVDVKLIASAAQSFGQIHGITTNLGYIGRTHGVDQAIYTLKYSISLNEKMAVMIENYGHFAFAGTAKSPDFYTYFDFGYSYLLTNDFQLDLQGGFSKNEIGDSGLSEGSWFVGGGISWRLNFNQ